MSRIGVIFDFDGVIVDSEEIQYRSYARVLRDCGVEIDAEEYEREWISLGQGPEYAVRTYSLGFSPDELRRRKGPVYREMLRAEAHLMPGVEAALARFSELRLALATNSSAADTAIVLDGFDLRRFFAAVVTREDYEGRKPKPDAFLEAARRLDLPPRRCVVIEDATKGVLAAQSAGSPCIAIPHAFTRRNDFSAATVVLDSLDEVSVELLRDLAGRAPVDQREVET